MTEAIVLKKEASPHFEFNYTKKPATEKADIEGLRNLTSNLPHGFRGVQRHFGPKKQRFYLFRLLVFGVKKKILSYNTTSADSLYSNFPYENLEVQQQYGIVSNLISGGSSRIRLSTKFNTHCLASILDRY